MDSKLFEARLIKELPSKSTIVLDSAAFHNKTRLISIAEKHEHKVIFLPPYSPELNPTENFWG